MADSTFMMSLVANAGSFVQGMTQAQAASDKTIVAMNQLTSAASSMSSAMQKNVASLSKLVIPTDTITKLTGLFSAVSIAKFGDDFEKEISKVKIVTGAAGKDLEKIRNKAIEIGNALGISGALVADAFTLMGSVRPELLKNIDALAETTRQSIILKKAIVAMGEDIDSAGAAKILGESLSQFGENANQAERFVNALAAGTKAGSSFILETSEALKKAGVEMAAAGLKFEEGNALVQLLAEIGIKGEEAGTKLRGVFAELANPAKLEKMGLKFSEINPQVVGLIGAFENLKKADLKSGEVLEKFEVRNRVAATYIMNNIDKLKGYITSISGTNAAQQAVLEKSKQLGDVMSTLKTTFENIAASISNYYQPALATVLIAMTKFASISMQSISLIVKDVNILGDGFAGVSDQALEVQAAVFAIKTVGKSLTPLLPLIGVGGSLWLGFTYGPAVILGVSTAWKAATTAIGMGFLNLTAQATVSATTTGAVWSLANVPLWGTGLAAEFAASKMTLLGFVAKTAATAVFAAWIGYSIGKYFWNEFESVRKAGYWVVGELQGAWIAVQIGLVELSGFFEKVGNRFSAAFQNPLSYVKTLFLEFSSYIQQKFSDLLEILAKGSSKLDFLPGMGDATAKLTSFSNELQISAKRMANAAYQTDFSKAATAKDDEINKKTNERVGLLMEERDALIESQKALMDSAGSYSKLAGESKETQQALENIVLSTQKSTEAMKAKKTVIENAGESLTVFKELSISFAQETRDLIAGDDIAKKLAETIRKAQGDIKLGSTAIIAEEAKKKIEIATIDSQNLYLLRQGLEIGKERLAVLANGSILQNYKDQYDRISYLTEAQREYLVQERAGIELGKLHNEVKKEILKGGISPAFATNVKFSQDSNMSFGVIIEQQNRVNDLMQKYKGIITENTAITIASLERQSKGYTELHGAYDKLKIASVISEQNELIQLSQKYGESIGKQIFEINNLAKARQDAANAQKDIQLAGLTGVQKEIASTAIKYGGDVDAAKQVVGLQRQKAAVEELTAAQKELANSGLTAEQQKYLDLAEKIGASAAKQAIEMRNLAEARKAGVAELQKSMEELQATGLSERAKGYFDVIKNVAPEYRNQIIALKQQTEEIQKQSGFYSEIANKVADQFALIATGQKSVSQGWKDMANDVGSMLQKVAADQMKNQIMQLFGANNPQQDAMAAIKAAQQADADRAKQFQVTIQEVDLSVKKTIEERSIDISSKMGTTIDEGVKKLTASLDAALSNLNQSMPKAIESFGKQMADAISGIKIGSQQDQMLKAQTAGFDNGNFSLNNDSDVKTKATQIAQFFMDKLSITAEQAAGIVGNFMRESKLNSRINEGGVVGDPRFKGGYGLAQWTGVRQRDLDAYAKSQGADTGDLLTQLNFTVKELQSNESRALQKLKETSTAAGAAEAFEKFYERAGIKAVAERQREAEKVFLSLTKTTETANNSLSKFSQEQTNATGATKNAVKQTVANQQETTQTQAQMLDQQNAAFMESSQNALKAAESVGVLGLNAYKGSDLIASGAQMAAAKIMNIADARVAAIHNMKATGASQSTIQDILSANSKGNLSGLAGVVTGSSQDQMLADQMAGFDTSATGFFGELGSGIKGVVSDVQGWIGTAKSTITGWTDSIGLTGKGGLFGGEGFLGGAAQWAGVAGSLLKGDIKGAISSGLSVGLSALGNTLLPGIGGLLGGFAANALTGLVMGGGETRGGGLYSVGEKGDFKKIQGPSGGDLGGKEGFDKVSEAMTGTVKQINGLLEKLGSKEKVVDFKGALETSEKGRGGVYSGGKLSSGKAFGEQFTGQNVFESQTSRTLNAEQATKAFQLDLMQATLQAIQVATDVPKFVSSILKDIDIEALDEKGVTALLTTIESINAMGDAMQNLGFSTDSITQSMIESAGGIESFKTNMSVFTDKFANDQDKTFAALNNATADLEKNLGALGGAIPQSRDSLVDMVKGLDLTSEAGQQAFGSLMKLMPALDQYYSIQENAVDKYFDVFGTAQQKAARSQEKLTDQFDKFGLQVPQSETAFQGLVEQLYAGDQASKNQAIALMNLYPQWKANEDAIKSTQKTQSDAVDSYYATFGTAQEKAAHSQANLTAQFDKFGAKVPQSEEEYKNLLQTLYAGDQAAKDQAVSLMNLHSQWKANQDAQLNAADSLTKFTTNLKNLGNTIDAQSVNQSLTKAVKDAKSPQEAGQNFSSNVMGSIKEQMTNTMMSTISDMVTTGIIQPMINAAIQSATIDTSASAMSATNDVTAAAMSGATLTTSAAFGGTALTTAGASAGAGLISGGQTAGEVIQAGGIDAAQSLVEGGKNAGIKVDEVIAKAKNVAQVMIQVMNDPEFKSDMAELEKALKPVGSAAYQGTQAINQGFSSFIQTSEQVKEDAKDTSKEIEKIDFKKFKESLMDFATGLEGDDLKMSKILAAFKDVDLSSLNLSGSLENMASQIANLPDDKLSEIASAAKLTVDDMQSYVLDFFNISRQRAKEALDAYKALQTGIKPQDKITEISNKYGVNPLESTFKDSKSYFEMLGKLSQDDLKTIAAANHVTVSALVQDALNYGNALKENEQKFKDFTKSLNEFSVIDKTQQTISDLSAKYNQHLNMNSAEYIKFIKGFKPEEIKAIAAAYGVSVDEFQTDALNYGNALKENEQKFKDFTKSLNELGNFEPDQNKKTLSDLSAKYGQQINMTSAEYLKFVKNLKPEDIQAIAQTYGISVDEVQKDLLDAGGALKGLAETVRTKAIEDFKAAIGAIDNSISSVKGGIESLNGLSAEQILEKTKQDWEKIVSSGQHLDQLTDATDKYKTAIDNVRQKQLQWIDDIKKAVDDSQSFKKTLESDILNLRKTLGQSGASYLDQISLIQKQLSGTGSNNLKDLEKQTELQGRLKDLILGNLDDQINAQQKVFDAQKQQFETQLDNAKALIDYAKDLKGFVDGLMLGDTSILTNEQRVNEAQRQYQETLAKAKGGDQDAIKGLSSVASTLLKETRNFYASSDTYTAIFKDVTSTVSSFAGSLESQGVSGTSAAKNGLAGVSSATGEFDATALQENALTQLMALETARQQTETDLKALLTQPPPQAIEQTQYDSVIATVNDAALASLEGMQSSLETLGNQTVDSFGVNIAKLSADMGMNTAQTVAAIQGMQADFGGRLSAIVGVVQQAQAEAAAAQAQVAAMQAAAQAQVAAMQAAAVEQSRIDAAINAGSVTTTGSFDLNSVMPSYDVGTPYVAAINAGSVTTPGSFDLNSVMPSYDVGTPYVSGDQVAQIHDGEMVIDPQSANVLRKYGISIPQMPTQTTASVDNKETIELLKKNNDLLMQLIQLLANLETNSTDQVALLAILNELLPREISRSFDKIKPRVGAK
jgi:hypothetical protein